MATPNVTTIPVGSKGADFVAATAAIDAWLDDNAATFVVRYIAGGSSWKHITPDEITHHHARGIAVVLNHEGSANDYTGGAAKGRFNGARAAQAAKALGYPEGLPLVVSVDTGLIASSLPLATAYVEAFFAAAKPYAPALYGPVNLYQQVARHAPLYWMPNATSWQIGLKPTDVVHVRQRRSLHPPGVDPNIVVTAFEAWLPTPDPAPTPPPPEVPPVDHFIRFKGYANVFAKNAAGAVSVAPNELDAQRGVYGDPLVIDHPPTMKSVLALSGLTLDELTPYVEPA